MAAVGLALLFVLFSGFFGLFGSGFLVLPNCMWDLVP